MLSFSKVNVLASASITLRKRYKDDGEINLKVNHRVQLLLVRPISLEWQECKKFILQASRQEVAKRYFSDKTIRLQISVSAYGKKTGSNVICRVETHIFMSNAIFPKSCGFRNN
jgi:hypothetical protein